MAPKATPDIFSRGLRAVLCILVGLATPAAAATSANDPHPITQAERSTFLRLTCRNATRGDEPGIYRCSSLSGYPGRMAPHDFRLSTVAYGALTRAGARQAYVTYLTLLEAHMFDFGGGVLFDRVGNHWKLVRWYRGGQMDRCVALPQPGRVRMLCLSAYTQGGELFTMVSVRAVPASARQSWDSAVPFQATAGPDVFRLLIRADDTRRMNEPPSSGSPECGTLSDYRARVLSIDTLRRSVKAGFFAESEATYVTPKQDYDACTTGAWAKLKGESMTIHYALKHGSVKIDSPVALGESSA